MTTPFGPSEEQRDELVEQVAREIELLGMTGPAVHFLEASRPYRALGANAMLFFDPLLRGVFGGELASASEILAHECGHTIQAIRLGFAYLPVVGSVTLFREGRHWWNYFENRASEEGQFGGIVSGSVSAELLRRAGDESRGRG